MNVFSTIRYLARQGLPLCGSDDGKESNFYQLLLLRSEASPGNLDRAQFKYTSPDVQNEILSIKALNILRKVMSQIQTSIYSMKLQTFQTLSR